MEKVDVCWYIFDSAEQKKRFPDLIPLAVFTENGGGNPDPAFEKTGKIGRIGEAQLIGDQ